MSIENLSFWKSLLEEGLREDGWPWDWTTLGVLQKGDLQIQAQVLAKSNGIWVGQGLIDVVNELVFKKGNNRKHNLIQSYISDGKLFHKGQILCRWVGSARWILALERPFLNLISYASGIATETHSLVDQVTQTCPRNPPRVTLTRKTLPHYRDLAIHAVQWGGGYSHRPSLSAGILIKENHIALAGGIKRAIQRLRPQAPHGMKIEVEVRSIKEFKEALQGGAEGILLDHFQPEKLQSALKWIVQSSFMSPFIEVSGGITRENISHYALPGVNVISVGGITHSIRAVDLSLLVI